MSGKSKQNLSVLADYLPDASGSKPRLLAPTYRYVFQMRRRGVSFTAIAKTLSVSESRVSQIHRKALWNVVFAKYKDPDLKKLSPLQRVEMAAVLRSWVTYAALKADQHVSSALYDPVFIEAFNEAEKVFTYGVFTEHEKASGDYSERTIEKVNSITTYAYITSLVRETGVIDLARISKPLMPTSFEKALPREIRRISALKNALDKAQQKLKDAAQDYITLRKTYSLAVKTVASAAKN